LVLLQVWITWIHYATFRMLTELNGLYGYNALQQIAYFAGLDSGTAGSLHVAKCAPPTLRNVHSS
jgi:hypothetical protein